MPSDRRRAAMWKLVLVVGAVLARTVTCFQIGFIPNLVFIAQDSNASRIDFNGSCVTCSCLANEQNYSGFNCFSSNKTCVMFPTYSMSYHFNATINATFYFLQLPTIGKNRGEKVSQAEQRFRCIRLPFSHQELIFKPVRVQQRLSPPLNRSSTEI